MTRFLQVPGASLENNVSEITLKYVMLRKRPVLQNPVRRPSRGFVHEPDFGLRSRDLWAPGRGFGRPDAPHPILNRGVRGGNRVVFPVHGTPQLRVPAKSPEKPFDASVNRSLQAFSQNIGGPLRSSPRQGIKPPGICRFGRPFSAVAIFIRDWLPQLRSLQVSEIRWFSKGSCLSAPVQTAS